LRDRYDDILGAGADVVAIGTGNRGYAAAFVADEHVPFPVLVDGDHAAADAASVPSVNFLALVLNPKSWPGARRARRAGHHIHRAGQRVTQLGATFVLGPGPTVRYEHVDSHSADHAPVDEVLATLPA
jgi:peroxiredoxin